MEFAIVALPFVALLIASIQTALVYLGGQALETATEKSARLLLTGKAQQTQGMDQPTFKALVCGNLPSLLNDCSKLLVDVQTYASFSSAQTSAPTITFNNGSPSNTWNFNPGTPGAIVVLRVMYLMPVVGGPLNFTLANVSDGSHLLLASAVFQNEPYQ